MESDTSRRLSLLACLLVPGMPAVAGVIAFRSQPILVAGIQGEPGRLPALTSFFFNHFSWSLILLLAVTVALALLAIGQLRRTDPAERLGGLLTLVCASALTSVLYLGLFVLAVALPLYANLTAR
ncbi:MAG: hypothetical protein ACO23N_02005 [Opitutales bacterium]|jgi:hypothetical protein